MKTSENIKIYLRDKKQATAFELANYLGISKQALYKQLTKLLENNEITKVGKPPRVFYFLKEEGMLKVDVVIDDEVRRIIEDQYLIITASGEQLGGVAGFEYWCQRNKLPIIKTANEYIATLKKYNTHKINNLIDGTEKIKTTFAKSYLDRLFYLDFYSIERFGKTRLGQLLLYAKQSQDRKMINELIRDIKPRVDNLISKYKIDGIGFIPPTVKRETQFMKVLEIGLNENIHKVSIVKLRTDVIVPQKTLNKLSDRIENAKNSIIVDENSMFNNILLIDDAVGSGASLNETARKIRERNICKGKIIGLAVTGSFKGFDVVSEV